MCNKIYFLILVPISWKTKYSQKNTNAVPIAMYAAETHNMRTRQKYSFCSYSHIDECKGIKLKTYWGKANNC